MSTTKRCFYEILGVAKTATDEEIKKSYRAQALKYHPDRNNGDDEAVLRFKEAAKKLFWGDEIAYLDDVHSAPSHFGDVEYARLELVIGNAKRHRARRGAMLAAEVGDAAGLVAIEH